MLLQRIVNPELVISTGIVELGLGINVVLDSIGILYQNFEPDFISGGSTCGRQHLRLESQ